MTFYAITSSDALWAKTISYASGCSWGAGKALAELMEKNRFRDWERVIVAVDEAGALCGFCTAVEKDCVPELTLFPFIGYVFIDERHRGKRLSQQMINYAMAYLSGCGFEKVYLVSDHESLYEKYGFVEIGRVNAYWGGEEKLYSHEI